MPLRRPVPAWVGAPAVGALAATVTVVGHGVVLGLLGPGPTVGAGDNGDGFRLFCTAGLRPVTPDADASWRGVVVTAFSTGHPPCPAGASAAGALLRVATTGAGPLWSLTTLAWLYVTLTALGAAVAAAALAGEGARRALLVAIPIAPLILVPWWSRFDVSTYAEPAGLLGAVWLLLGAVVVAGTGAHQRGSRAAALVLVGAGGLVAATAKPGFVPIGVVAVAACATIAVGAGGRRVRGAGPVAALLVVALGAGPVAGEVRAQDRVYGAINTHNRVFTALLPEAGLDAPSPSLRPPLEVIEVLTRLGLPPDAARASGESWYWAAARDVPGWDTAIGADAGAARARAHAVLRDDPAVLARMVGRGLVATLRPQLTYLPSAPRGSAPERDEVRTIYPETAPVGAVATTWAAGIALPGLPAVLILLAGLAATATVRTTRRRGGRPTAVGLARVAALAAAAALGLVALAVVGDGYYELTKHVWLASYLLVVTGLLLAAAGVGAVSARAGRSRAGRP